MLRWLVDLVVWCFKIPGIPPKPKPNPVVGRARFCSQCWGWLGADDQGRFDKGGEMLAAVCEPCIHHLAKRGAAIIKEEGA